MKVVQRVLLPVQCDSVCYDVTLFPLFAPDKCMLCFYSVLNKRRNMAPLSWGRFDSLSLMNRWQQCFIKAGAFARGWMCVCVNVFFCVWPCACLRMRSAKGLENEIKSCFWSQWFAIHNPFNICDVFLSETRSSMKRIYGGLDFIYLEFSW